MNELNVLSIGELREISQVNSKMEGNTIQIKGFLSTIRRTARFYFITLRDQLDTIQCIAATSVCASSDKQLLPEAYIQVAGIVKSVPKPITSCTKKDVEIEAKGITVIGSVHGSLPFNIKDAAASETERAGNPSLCAVSYSHRLDYRFLDLRVPSTQAIFRVVDGTMNSFRTYLRAKQFTEIKTTKIIGSGSEGGANLFAIDYFGDKAYLAQSPQLYKQMAILGGLKRVFEVGHVYRAEESNINRYLSEFTGLDLEMELNGSYLDAIYFIYDLFVYIFDSLRSDYKQEIEIIRKYKEFEDIVYKKEPIVVDYCEAVRMLQEDKVEIKDGEDFSRENERKLGELVKKKHGIDFFVVKDYPKDVRAFYTYAEESSRYSHSYDFILRGEEILSGAERISDPEQLAKRVEANGIPVESLKSYIDAFKFGAPRHAGCGIGLERLLKAYFGFEDIRYFALFPRDPKRLAP